MHALGKGLGNPVGEGLHHNRAIVVVCPSEAVGDLVLLRSRGDDKAAGIIGFAALRWSDEVGKREIGLPIAALQLLAKREKGRKLRSPRLPLIKLNVVACAVRGPKPDDGLGIEPALRDGAAKHPLSVSIKLPRGLAFLWIIQNRGKTAAQFPSLEERCPIDVRDKLFEIVMPEHPRPGKDGPRRIIACPIRPEGVGARFR